MANPEVTNSDSGEWGSGYYGSCQFGSGEYGCCHMGILHSVEWPSLNFGSKCKTVICNFFILFPFSFMFSLFLSFLSSITFLAYKSGFINFVWVRTRHRSAFSHK